MNVYWEKNDKLNVKCILENITYWDKKIAEKLHIDVLVKIR